MNEQQLKQIKFEADYSWLGLPDIHEIIARPNPLYPKDIWQKENFHLFITDILRQPENFYFTCKHIFNLTLPPFQLVMLEELWKRPYPMLIGTRGASKSFILAVFVLLYAFLNQGTKVVICGAGFRQSKIIFEYIERIWENAPLLRNAAKSFNVNSDHKKDTDGWKFIIGHSVITAIPIGDGSKIRGLRASLIVVDEFASMDREIYEVSIEPFGSVSASPVESMKNAAKKAFYEKNNISIDSGHFANAITNKTVLSGTAFYAFNHFAEYWERYHNIIASKGDRYKLEEILGGPVPEEFDWTDFSIIRIPCDMIPEGFLQQKMISRAKATVHTGTFQMEYGACFIKDSTGFFKRSLIESCVCSDEKPIKLASGNVSFNAALHGHSNRRYVFGVDPVTGSTSSDGDNFSIVILELWPDHRRIVYVWTTNKKSYQKQRREKKPEDDFYAFCARKIKSLLKLFPCIHISMDSQGGGGIIRENLSHDDEWGSAILPVPEEKPQPTDFLKGEHILEMVNFASADWTSGANHGLRNDLEKQYLLFPHYDSLSVALASEYDNVVKDILNDGLEEVSDEIEILKSELSNIVMTITPGGRERWDTPEVKVDKTIKGKMRKDRYSALLMANMAARTIANLVPVERTSTVGGYIGAIAKHDKGQNFDYAPVWFKEYGSSNLGTSVRRGV